MNEAEANRELLAEARRVEQQRVELQARAIERNVADLLPHSWVLLASYKTKPLVSVAFETGVEEADAQRWSDRECREFVRWLGRVADDERRKAGQEP